MNADLLSGKTIDSRYLLMRELGSGANGVVYEAEDQQLGRQVAIKVLLNWNAQSQDINRYQRLEREAKALNELIHPNIVRVFRFGKLDDGVPFLVMELARGETLRALLNRRQRLRCDEVVAIALQICTALDFAHSRNIVHRDLKPENVIVEVENNWTAKLLDFGLCKNIDSEIGYNTLTATGFVLGSVNYMSPEQAMGRAADKASDVYSFGIVLYELITGSLPWTADVSLSILLKQINEPMPRFLDLSPESGLPQELQSLVLDCTQKNPERRPNFTEVREALQLIDKLQCKQTYVIPSKSKPLARLNGRLSLRVILGSIALLSMLLGSAYYLLFQTEKGQSLVSNYVIYNFPPAEAVAELSRMLKQAVSSGEFERAENILDAITSSSRYLSWTALERENLLLSYRAALLDKGQADRAFNVEVRILKQVLESENALRQAARASYPDPDLMVVSLNPEEIKIAESISSKLLSKKLSRKQYTALANLFISHYNTFSRHPSPYLIKTLILRARSYIHREGGQNYEGRYEMLKIYFDTANTALSIDHQLALRIAEEGIALSKKYEIPGLEIQFEILMGQQALERGDCEMAKQYYAAALPLSKFLLLSGAEQNGFYALQIGCKLCRKVGDEEVRKIKPELFRKYQKKEFHELILGEHAKE